MADPDHFEDDGPDEGDGPTREIPALAEVGDGSPLAALKAKRARITAKTTEDFAVPNNDDLLWATYKVLPYKRVQALTNRVEESENDEAELLAAADFIGEACVALSLRDPATGELTPLSDDPDVPVKFDLRLVDLLELGDPPPGKRGGPGEWTERAIVRRVVGPGGRDVAVVAHQRFLLMWMQGIHAKADDAYAGE